MGKRRPRLRDLPQLLCDATAPMRQERRIAARRRRADATRKGSLTYNRQQALRRWQELQSKGEP
jgi:hypothetical protein